MFPSPFVLNTIAGESFIKVGPERMPRLTGKWPIKNGSLKVTFLIAFTEAVIKLWSLNDELGQI